MVELVEHPVLELILSLTAEEAGEVAPLPPQQVVEGAEGELVAMVDWGALLPVHLVFQLRLEPVLTGVQARLGLSRSLLLTMLSMVAVAVVGILQHQQIALVVPPCSGAAVEDAELELL
jgi:hypothetical protein